MFNLQSHREENIFDILRRELSILEITRLNSHAHKARIGDEFVIDTLPNIKKTIQEAINELKSLIWNLWDNLAHLCDTVVYDHSANTGTMQNSLFLNNVKRIYGLSSIFPDLTDVSQSIKKIFYIDMASIGDELVKSFNLLCLKIRLTHHLIMREIYRTKVISHYLKFVKTAQISGPWANLDLPMQERKWEWDDEENEYFAERDEAKKQQVRYNPEAQQGCYGFYFVWNDMSRGPYNFGDVENSPYKSRLLLTIP